MNDEFLIRYWSYSTNVIILQDKHLFISIYKLFIFILLYINSRVLTIHQFLF
jgi:hypothetical protein